MRCPVFYILLFIIFSASVSVSQNLHASVDWAVFDYDAENLYVELYYSIPQSDLNYQNADGKLRAATLCQVALMDGDKIVVSNAWKSETFAADSTELAQAKTIIDRVGFIAPAGTFNCLFILRDLIDESNSDSASWEMNLALAEPGRVHLSDIQLASSIRRATEQDKKSPFYKNSLVIEPNPAALYSFEHPALFFYAEAYSLPVDQLPEGYRLKYYVLDADGQIPEGLTAKAIRKKKALSPSVEFGMINVGNLKSGAYTLNLEIQNSERETLGSKSKKFYVLQKEDLEREFQARRDTPFESSVFARMDSADVEKEYLMIFYLLSKDEQILHKQLTDLEGKRHFLYNFWKNKYPEMSVNDNPMRNEYLRRARIADERFNAFKMPGWLTDRGRVFMVYGEPDDIERHPNEPNMYEYEIWFYNKLQNGVRFIFADFEGYKNFRLIHSDLNGEVKDRNYRQTLMKASGY